MTVEQNDSILLDAMVRMLPSGVSPAVMFPGPRGEAYIDNHHAYFSSLEALAVLPPSRRVVGDIGSMLVPEIWDYAGGNRLDGEDYYLLRSLSLLRNGGILAILLSDDILTSCQKQRLRALVLKLAHVEAIVSFAHIRGSIVILRRRDTTFDLRQKETLFLQTMSFAASEDIEIVLAFLSDRCVASGISKGDRRVMTASISETSWLLRAQFADKELLTDIPDCVSLSRYIKLVDRPRELKQDRPSYLADNTDGGIVPSARFMRKLSADPFLRYCNVIESGDLLLTRQIGRMVANVVASEQEGLIVSPDSQAYEMVFDEFDRSRMRLIALLFQSDKYCRYLARRLSRSAWKVDVPNLLIPQVDSQTCFRLLEEAEYVDHQKKALNSLIRSTRTEISKVYRHELGVGTYRSNLLDAAPVIRMSEMLLPEPCIHRFGSSRMILKNLNVSVAPFDPVFLEGLLLSDLVSERVRFYSYDLSCLRYPTLLSRNILLPRLSMEIQQYISRNAHSMVERFKELVIRKADLTANSPVKQILDNEVFYAYNPR